MADLQELFARLKAQSSETQSPSQTQSGQVPSIWAQPQQTPAGYQPPSVSSPIFSPQVHTPNPVHSSHVLSPAQPASTTSTPAPMDSARTNNLLSLLKFNNTAGAPSQSVMAGLQNVAVQNVSVPRSPSYNLSAEPRSLSAQDLVASMQRKTSGPTSARSPLATPPLTEVAKTHAPSTSGNQQDLLLNLLKKPGNIKSTQQAILTRPETLIAPDTTISNEHPIISSSVGLSSSLEPPLTELAHPTAVAFEQSADPPPALNAPKSARPSMFSYVNPFDQLHTSSPLHQPLNPPPQSNSKNVEILKKVSVPAAQTTAEAGTTIDNIVRDTNKGDGPNKSVSQTLEGVGKKVDKQVERALANAVAQTTNTQLTATGNGEKEDDVESNWESAEDSATEKHKGDQVSVYNFPMKPFVSIQINGDAQPAVPMRQDNFMVIASLKKEFDQIDRCLATASQSHIVYAQAATKKDNKGFRIIRQDTGDHKSIFRSAGERIFNVQICSPPGVSNDVETVLGTSVCGSVFWTTLSKSQADMFSEEDLEGQGFVMPPVKTPEESTSGSPVKTRAKLSHRHTEFFALARGKQIYLVSPRIAKAAPYYDPTTKKVNSKQYLADQSLCIHTTKAGKDFCFSEDDSLIASLDKSGRVKFWDIRQLVERATSGSGGTYEPIELREPLMQLSTAASGTRVDEKPSVSSIMLLDKERPHAKGIALRYMLIGFKQNHILQLWDLGLNKAVQEVRLPHEKDSDGICSLSYHPKTGILTIGHPTRNCIYFLHLSAPKYNIPFMDQARYVEMLARGDTSLPRPESTAIMSGLRELSFNSVGQIRSIDMLKTPVENANEKGGEDETLFELYVFHSKGVVCIGIKRADLGWNAENRMQNPVDALEAGVIEVSELKLAAVKESVVGERVNNEDTPSKKPSDQKENKKLDDAKNASKIEIMKKDVSPQTPVRASNLPSMTDKNDLEPLPAKAPATQHPALVTPEPSSVPVPKAKSLPKEPATNISLPIVQNGGESLPSRTDKASSEQNATEAIPNLKQYFDSLYQRLDADKRVSEAAAGAKQDAILRLVSSTLTDNIEQTLHRIISESIRVEVVPGLSSTVGKLIDSKLVELIPQQLQGAVTREVKAILPASVQSSLNDTKIHQAIAKGTADQVAVQIQRHMSTVQQSISTATVSALQRAVADVEKRTNQQVREAEDRRQQDATKIDELSSLVRNLTSTVQRMADGQAALQEQLATLRQQQSHETALELPAADPAPPSSSVPVLSVEEQEIDDITKTLVAGQYQEATMQWLQSPRQGQLFDQLFIRVNPQYLQQVTPLVALSVSAAVTASLDTNVDQRLEWLAAVLAQIDLRDQDIRDVAPQILGVLSQRLQGAYMSISEGNSSSPILRKISSLNRQVTELRRVID